MRLLSSFLVVLSLALVSPPALGQQPTEFVPVPEEERVEITFLANEGFLLKSGEFSVLIDAFVKEPYSIYEAVPPSLYRKMILSEPPFDGYTLGLVSHRHQDHFQPRAALKFLTKNDESILMSSPQVFNALKEVVDDISELENIVRVIPLKIGESKILAQDTMTIEFMRMRHGGPDNANIQNYAHLITMGGLKILHVGDADATQENFLPFSLEKRDIDIAFIPYWYFGSEEGVAVIDEEIHANHLIACHMPAKNRGGFLETMKAENPHVLIFESPGDKKVFQKHPESGGDEAE